MGQDKTPPQSRPALEISVGFAQAVVSKQPTVGYTHTFYKYPARFSPQFAAAAIEEFSKPGDVVLDPFVGSGTTLVEAMIAGRHAIGSDISPLATFITRTKTRGLNDQQATRILTWSRRVVPKMSVISAKVEDASDPDRRKHHVAWPIRNILSNTLASIEKVKRKRDREFLRCALLSAAQEAIDNTYGPPTAKQFREIVMERIEEHCTGARRLHERLNLVARHRRPRVVCINAPAARLQRTLWSDRITARPTLVVTSPPYPLVHVLYHRWQVNGRRETSAPFWIIDSQDGQGAAHYTMGGRSAIAEKRYFSDIEHSFRVIHGLLADDATVVQLLAFSDPDTQLPLYLDRMSKAGFQEQRYRVVSQGEDQRLWRDVPLRKWYATYRGRVHASREVLLIHRRV